MTRASWDEYFMKVAEVVASRSTCDRKQVGAVVVRDKIILSTGYNGSLRGLPHCSEVGHMIENEHCVATIHAEQNAIIQAARTGVTIDGGMIYVTASPCWSCFKCIANAGLRRMTDGELSTQNALNLLRGVRRREPSLLPYLDRVAANPGTVIKPEHRAALFRKWARRIRRGRP